MSLFAKLKLIFTYGPELESILKGICAEKREQERLRNINRLNLCFNHRQESNHSHYSDGNCDHCRALAKIKELESRFQI